MTVLALLNFEGSNGSNVFTDEAGLTWSINNGQPVLTNVEKAGGSTSLSLDGASSIKTSHAALSSTFTIEGWMKTGEATGISLVSFPESADNYFFGLMYNQWVVVAKNFGGEVYDNTSAAQLVNKWVHLAWTVDSGKIYIFVNGLMTKVSDWTPPNDLANAVIGSFSSGATDYFTTGLVDSVRITEGEALYKTAFIPPIFPNLTPLSHLLDYNFTQSDFISHSGATSEPSGMSDRQSLNLSWLYPWLTAGAGGGTDPDVEPEPNTSTNIISGNVKKLGLAYSSKVVAVSIGINPVVVGFGESDDTTGNYSIDIYPHVDEVVIYTVPDYGDAFTESRFVSAGSIMHPTTPNKYVYKALNSGTIAASEPAWSITGDTVSGEVTFQLVPLFRPLANGFLKPVITAI